MVPSKSLFYIGFLTDTNVMKYFPPATKILPFFANLLCTLLDLFMCDTVGVRAAQHILGGHVKVSSYKNFCWLTRSWFRKNSKWP